MEIRQFQDDYVDDYQDDYEEDDTQRPFQEPEFLPEDFGNAQFPNQDEGFLQWLFSFRKEAITPLRNVWRGKEFNYTTMKWEEGRQKHLRVMNEKGITWAISLIESYMSPAFIVSDFDDKSYNFTMRELAKIIWNNLCLRYKEFEIKKSDIPRVAEEIEAKVRAILLGAKDNGYRDFFSTQNQNIETKNLTPQLDQKRPGVFANMATMFRKMENQQQRY